MGATTGERGRPPGRSQLVFEGMPEPLYAVSPSRLLAWLDCPRRYRMQYLDRPRPPTRPQRAHTSVGIAVHNALRDWWDLPLGERTPEGGAELVRTSWIEVGFRDADQSARWRMRAQAQVGDYLSDVDPTREPRGVERTVSMKVSRTSSAPRSTDSHDTSTDTASGMCVGVSGRVDRLDDRDGELVVVDYKTSRVAPTADDARTSLPLALYAGAVWKMFRRRCVAVELHHIPSGTVARHEHSSESLARKVDEALSIARDARAADRDHEERGVEASSFPPRVSALCRWCDYRAHCPEGQAQGPEMADWAGLGEEEASGAVSREAARGVRPSPGTSSIGEGGR